MALDPFYDSPIVPPVLIPDSTFGLGMGPDLSIIQQDPQNFQLSLDVHNFDPSELDIKHINDSIVIHGKHEERNDPHGFLKREFTRRFTLPPSVDASQICCHLGNNQLTILGPQAARQAERAGSRCLSIDHVDCCSNLAQAEALEHQR